MSREDLNGFGALLVGALVGVWIGVGPVLQALLVFMVIDIVTGFLAGFVTQTLSSSISMKGMAKKTMMLLLVLAAVWAGRITDMNIPMGEIVAGFYAANELLSIIENAARANLPIPDVLRVALVKLGRQNAGGESRP